MPKGKKIVDTELFNIILNRLTQQLLENHGDFSQSCIVGIQEKGVVLAERLVSILQNTHKLSPLFGKLDITFYRDDYRMRDEPLKANSTDIDFSIENKKLILVDDVVYTGRTIHAAIAALQDVGRPSSIELLCLIDRRFNRHFPVRTDYYGKQVDALDQAYVKVEWNHIEGADQVLFFEGKK